jgi:hypothetical protein
MKIIFLTLLTLVFKIAVAAPIELGNIIFQLPENWEHTRNKDGWLEATPNGKKAEDYHFVGKYYLTAELNQETLECERNRIKKHYLDWFYSHLIENKRVTLERKLSNGFTQYAVFGNMPEGEFAYYIFCTNAEFIELSVSSNLSDTRTKELLDEIVASVKFKNDPSKALLPQPAGGRKEKKRTRSQSVRP